MHHKPLKGKADYYMPMEGPLFRDLQLQLVRFNSHRLSPSLPYAAWREQLTKDQQSIRLEGEFIEAARREIQPLMSDLPSDPNLFISWFESLKDRGPGQGDPLFPFLATEASLEQMKWFLLQEVAGEAGFDDLVALTQLKMPVRPKLEMARNYWDEMGRGAEKGMHGPMLERLANFLEIAPEHETTVPESLALGNVMMALACNPRYAFHSVGALGAIEMTAPTRAVFVVEGLRRLGVPAKQSHYFSLHAVLDVKHSAAWNDEVLKPLVQQNPDCIWAIAEGALLRLWCGSRCFTRYRKEFKLGEIA